ncbi:MAG: BlaI/MecI/CopY family transcriptional regulator [Planctomycetes bacterium]|nr:BlaI/MecI/CopY family transcriptional regulator [Planctomycetota bacterium]
MSPEANDRPTAAEWKVLKIVYELGSCAAREVIERAQASGGWSASTVKTLLRRLVDKGHLRARRIGTSFLYRPSRPIHTELRSSADALLARATEGAIGPLLQYLVQRSRLSDEELDQLQESIDRQRQEGRGDG